MVDLDNFDFIKQRLHARLLNEKWHESALNFLAKEPIVADIYRTWYVGMSDIYGEHALIAVTDDIMRRWGATILDLERRLVDTRDDRVSGRMFVGSYIPRK